MYMLYVAERVRVILVTRVVFKICLIYYCFLIDDIFHRCNTYTTSQLSCFHFTGLQCIYLIKYRSYT